MKVELVRSSLADARPQRQYLTSYLIDDEVCLDAGSVGFMPLERQRRIQHVLISHTHMDHIASLPMFLENVYTDDPECINVYASQSVADTLQQDLFNDRVWPDFVRLSQSCAPFLDLKILENEVEIDLGGLKVRPIQVDHVVPTLGFLFRNESGSVLISSDTGPTERLWHFARELDDLKAIFLECSFPNELESLALETKHLTPNLFAKELEKSGATCPAYAVHIKSVYLPEVAVELDALSRDITICEPGQAYSFE